MNHPLHAAPIMREPSAAAMEKGAVEASGWQEVLNLAEQLAYPTETNLGH